MRVLVQEADFDVAAELTRLTDGRTDVGGIGCFVGTVRGDSGGHALDALTLEHYPAMTEAALAGIAAEATRRWDLLGCTVIHRVGCLLPGARIVLVLAAAAHRQPALDATGFLIDWLKTTAPFWKKESFTDGREAWVDPRAEDHEAAARWSDVAAPPA